MSNPHLPTVTLTDDEAGILAAGLAYARMEWSEEGEGPDSSVGTYLFESRQISAALESGRRDMAITDARANTIYMASGACIDSTTPTIQQIGVVLESIAQRMKPNLPNV